MDDLKPYREILREHGLDNAGQVEVMFERYKAANVEEQSFIRQIKNYLVFGKPSDHTRRSYVALLKRIGQAAT